MKSLIAFVCLALFTTSAPGQARPDFDLSGFGVKIEADKRLIVVRTALEIAGVQTELTEKGEEFRRKVRADFKKLDPDLRAKLRIFVDQYRKRHKEDSPAELVSPFISMAYSLSAVPALEEPERTYDLPDSLLEVLDFSPLVRELYGTPGAAQKINEYHSTYQDEIGKLQPSARQMVRDVLDYLHTRPHLSYIERVKIESTEGNKKLTKYEPVEKFRAFTIAPDFLASKGTVNFLNVGDDYFAIIPPDTDISSSEVRRAYLQFVLDPLVLNEAQGITVREDAIRILINKQNLKKTTYLNDPILTVTRSLVAAVDIREELYRKEQLATEQARRTIDLMKTDEDRRKVAADLNRLKAELADEAALRLSESYERGAVFSFYFAEKLVGIEQSGFDIAGSIKDWIATLNPAAENDRLEQNRVASQRAILTREKRKTEKAAPLVENPLTKELLKVDGIVKERKFADAEKRLNELLQEYSENTVETARIFYSLGRMNSLVAENTKDPEEVGLILEKAANNYKEVLRRASPSDRALISSTYFALGRIYEHFDQADYALQIYDAALRIGKVQGGAFEEAFEAKKMLLAKKAN